MHLALICLKLLTLNQNCIWIQYYITTQNLEMYCKKHAPRKSKFIRDTHQQPWFSDEIKGEIVLRRKMERIWKREKTSQAWKDFYTQHKQGQTSLKKHNAITTNRLLKNTSMTTKPSLILQMEYFLGNKNQLYHQQDLSLY